MAKQYSINGFLHSTNDYSFIEQYFRNRGINDFTYTIETDPKKRRASDDEAISKISDIIKAQDEDTQQEIERDFSDINKLSDDKGIESLLAEAKDQSFTAPLSVVAHNNGHEIAFWFFNNQKSIFDGANAVQEFFTSGWKRVPVPNKPIEIVSEKKEALEKALKDYYQSRDKGLGQRCLIDIYQKKDRVYVVAYISARGVNDVIPDEEDEGKLKKSTRRESIEIYFLYLLGEDAKEGGELEIKSRGGYTTERELLGVFSEAVLEHTLDDTKQKYDLEVLKDQSFSLMYDAEDEVEGWWLKGLDLKTPDLQTKIKLTTKDENRVGSETMWQKLKDLQLSHQMGSLRLDRAEMKIKFKPTKKHPKGTKTFYITWKDTSSLNDIDDLDIKAGKVLKKSKIDCGFSN
jgi:hypothetical protein